MHWCLVGFLLLKRVRQFKLLHGLRFLLLTWSVCYHHNIVFHPRVCKCRPKSYLVVWDSCFLQPWSFLQTLRFCYLRTFHEQVDSFNSRAFSFCNSSHLFRQMHQIRFPLIISFLWFSIKSCHSLDLKRSSFFYPVHHWDILLTTISKIVEFTQHFGLWLLFVYLKASFTTLARPQPKVLLTGLAYSFIIDFGRLNFCDLISLPWDPSRQSRLLCC